jgi:(1->4)-alpha-D-glucan 1-alpha-D-glucosylmutase
MRLQQISAAVMAKGVEDTAFYRYYRLVSLNEVGGSPERFGVGVEEFHRVNAETARDWPATMLTLSTHDTKRGADVRARINLLSEIPERWAEAVRSWMKINDKHRSGGWPDHNIEYLLYQTLVGVWPIDEDRVLSYLQKASKEAKEHTSWTDPNPGYDEALATFVRGVLRDGEFRRDLRSFVDPLLAPAWVNGLSQMLLLLTSPGVPDVYQGTELWDLSLVDPDNRRPVDFTLRRRLLDQLQRTPPEGLWAQAASGLPKMAVIRAALSVRRRLPGVFAGASEYRPLDARGPMADRVVAFGRGGAAVTVVPRLAMGITGGDAGRWAVAEGRARQTAVTLPSGRWLDEITGHEHEGDAVLPDLWSALPVALLTRVSP